MIEIDEIKVQVLNCNLPIWGRFCNLFIIKNSQNRRGYTHTHYDFELEGKFLEMVALRNPARRTLLSVPVCMFLLRIFNWIVF